MIIMSSSKITKISYSAYSLYKNCGHRYYLENIIEAPDFIPSIYAYFGDAMHDSLRKGVEHSLNEEERINNFIYVFKKLVMDNLQNHSEFAKLKEFTEQGIEILKIVPTERLSEKYIFIGAEELVVESMYKNYSFIGFIDLILKNKLTGKYVIIDWKTSTFPWDVKQKKSDKTFISQMMFYKYFYALKKNIPLQDVDCKYVVLNRLKKSGDKGGYGAIQNVEIDTDESVMEEALEDLAKITRDIFIKKVFTKAKLEKRKDSCKYCPFNKNYKLCNDEKKQELDLVTA
jgi:hypothetical protein